MLHDTMEAPPEKSKSKHHLILNTFLSVVPYLAFFLLLVYDPTVELERKQRFKVSMLIPELDIDSFQEVYDSPESQWKTKKYMRPDASLLEDHKVWRRIEIPPNQNNARFTAEFDIPMNRQSRFVLVENGKIVEDQRFDHDQPSRSSNHLDLATTFNFKSGSVPRTLFVYQDTTTIGGSDVSIRTDEEFVAYSRFREMAVGLIAGIAFGLALYHAFLGFKLGEKLYLYYAMFLSLSLVIVGYFSGLLTAAGEALGVTFSATILFTLECFIATNASLALFQDRFLTLENCTNLRSKKVLRYHLMTSMAAALIVPFTRPCSGTFLSIAATIPFWGIQRSFLSKHRHEAPVLRYLIINSVYVFGCCVSLIVFSNLIESSALKLYFCEISTLGTCVAFSPFFSKKIRALENQRHELIARLTRRGSNADKDSMDVTDHSENVVEQASVAILFVDVVAFSQLASPLPSRVVFEELSLLMQEISDIVQKQGGIIDRSLGDGLLCFFSINPTDDFGENSLRAFRAACEIQSFIVDTFSTVSSSSKMTLVMPVRIGIHSAQVVIGNLGGEQRVDFTMVGTGVNFASRLESACTPFRIIVSNSCFEDLKHLDQDINSFVPIALSVKHQSELIEAYEYNPLAHREDDVQKVRLRYFNQLGIEAKETRVPITETDALILKFGSEKLTVTDISINGMKVTGHKLFGQRSILPVSLLTKDPLLNEKLAAKLLDKFSVEVRWGRVTQNGFEHGLKIHGGNQKQRQYIFYAVCQRFGAQTTYSEPTPFDQAS